MDDLRYFVMSLPEPAKPVKPAPTIIESDKERLVRINRREKWMRNL
jgi:hypothetical protein